MKILALNLIALGGTPAMETDLHLEMCQIGLFQSVFGFLWDLEVYLD